MKDAPLLIIRYDSIFLKKSKLIVVVIYFNITTVRLLRGCEEKIVWSRNSFFKCQNSVTL